MDDCKQTIKQCFWEIKALYPAWWDNHYKSKDDVIDAMNIWYKHLGRLPADTISRAFNKAVQAGDYIPNALSVLKYSRPDSKDLGLPTDHQAFRSWLAMVSLPPAARAWDTLHPAVGWCHQYIAEDYCNLRLRPEAEQKRAFLELWAEAVQLTSEGKPLNIALDAPERPVAANTDKLADSVPVKRPKPADGPKRASMAMANISKLREMVSD